MQNFREIVRKIPGLPYDIEAAVVVDTDDIHVLAIEHKIGGEIKFATHFNIVWIEDDESRVDWLAYVISNIISRSYYEGGVEVHNKAVSSLAGLKNLLNWNHVW